MPANDSEMNQPDVAAQKVRVFALTWISYATYYLGRKSFGIVKRHLETTLGISARQLGLIDTGYLAAYSAGQFVMGYVGDRIGPRRLLGMGMIAVAVCVALFGAAKTALMFFVLYTLNGFFQGSGWPGNVKAMASWFNQKERGKVMGAWSTCYQLGGLAAAGGATYCFKHYGWQAAFYMPATQIALVGVLVFLFLPEKVIGAAQKSSVIDEKEKAGESPTVPGESRWEIYKNPVIWSLAGAYFCLKLIRYSILFWFPYYMSKVLHYDEGTAGYQSVSFETGGVLGSVIVGWISDKYFPGRRRQIASIMSLCLAAALFLYTRAATISVFMNFMGMALVGFCLFGPDTLICGSAAQDIGGKRNVAKAAGFINGVGSIGAIFQGIVTTEVSAAYGWNALFYIFIGMAILSSIVLLLGKSRLETPAAEA